MIEPNYKQVLEALIDLYQATTNMVERIGEHDQYVKEALTEAERIMDQLREIGSLV